MQNSSAVFTKYALEEIIRVSRLDFFLINLIVTYLNSILISDTNKVLQSLVDIQEFIRWVVCWLYMDFWVVITNRQGCCSTMETFLKVFFVWKRVSPPLNKGVYMLVHPSISANTVPRVSPVMILTRISITQMSVILICWSQ